MDLLRSKIHYILILILLSAFSTTGRAQIIQPAPPAELKAVDVTEHLGNKVPLDLIFTNDAGEKVPLSQYFNQGKPVVLVMAYYTCPMLCTVILDGVADGLRQLDWDPGHKYQILTVSIDSTETLATAKARKEELLNAIRKPGSDQGWRLFIGGGDQIRALAEAVGFHYYYDKSTKQYAHPAVVMILTEDGRISRYLYGVEFKKQDLKLALLEASEGKIGTTLDRIILFCYHYNPEAKGYVLFANNLMKLGGVLTVVGIGLFLILLWKSDLKKRRKEIVSEPGQ